MNYQESPGHVACVRLARAAPATKKDEFAALTARPGYIVPGSNIAEFQPACIANFRNLSNLKPISPFFGRSTVCLFAHHCRSPGGNDRLVCVDMDLEDLGSGFGWEDYYSLSGMVIRPASILAGSVALTPYGERLFMSYNAGSYDSSYFRLFTGRPDPADPSHFTIDYEVGICPKQREVTDPLVVPVVVRGTIDGRLRDNDTVVLSPRGGKLTENKTWSLNDPLAAPATAPPGR